MAENNLLRNAEATRLSAPIGGRAGTYVYAVVALSLIGMLAVIGISLIPGHSGDPAVDASRENQRILYVLGFLVPTVTALLAAAVQEVHVAVNSRLSQFVALTAKSSLAEGIASEKIRQQQQDRLK